MSCLLISCLQERVVFRTSRLIVERESCSCQLLVPERVPNHPALFASLYYVSGTFAALSIRSDVLLVISYYWHTVGIAQSVVKGSTL
jgi:hypothetical protein